MNKSYKHSLRKNHSLDSSHNQMNGVIIVSKEANLPNSHELQPIDRYWDLVKKQLMAPKGFA